MSIRNAVCIAAVLALLPWAGYAATAVIETPVQTGTDGSGNLIYEAEVKITTGASETLSGWKLAVEFDASCLASGVDPTASLGDDMPTIGSALEDNVVSTVSSGAPTGQDRTLNVIGTILNQSDCLSANTEHHVATLEFKLIQNFDATCGLSWNVDIVDNIPQTTVTSCPSTGTGIETGLMSSNVTPTPGTKILFPCSESLVLGKVAYWAGNRKIQNVTVKDADNPTPSSSTDTNGNYSLTYPSVSSRNITASRTPEDNERVSLGTFDVILCRREVATIESLGPDGEITCDIDTDGDLQADDCVDIAQEIIGIVTGAGEWIFHGGTGAPNLTSGVENPTNVPSSAFMPCNATRDWKGYLLGDCNGSWPNLNPPSKPQGPVQVPMALELADHEASDITVHLTANVEREELHGVVFTLAYDASELEFLGTAPARRAAEFMVLDNPSERGIVRVFAAGWKAPATVSGEMLELRFRRTGSGTVRIEITEMSVNDRPPFNLPTLEINGDENHVVSSPGRYFVSGYPNPFNPAIKIQFGVPSHAGSVPVRLRVLDVAGRVVRTLVHSSKEPGFHDVVWNGTDARGNRVESGIYFIQARLGDWTEVQKVTVLK